MSQRQFLIQLGLLSLSVAILIFFLNRLPQLQPSSLLSWASLAAFIAMSVIMFFAGSRAARSDNKNDFTNVVLGFTIGKMFLSIMIIYAYFSLMQPEGKWFIIPFFIVYFMYTAFETYFMMKLGKTKV